MYHCQCVSISVCKCVCVCVCVCVCKCVCAMNLTFTTDTRTSIKINELRMSVSRTEQQAAWREEHMRQEVADIQQVREWKCGL